MRQRELATYCRADKDFFDVPGRVADHDSRYDDPTPLTEHWRRRETGVWFSVAPIAAQLPEQGWKVHVSSTLDDARKVLDIVWRYCTGRGLAFKYVRSEKLLLLMNEKGFPRGASGKFITIYPCDDAELTTVLGELGPALETFTGPYILTDLRHRKGPCYVRYGAFASLRCATEDGDFVPALRRPDGALAPDPRSPGFTPPSWLELPAVLGPDLAARQENATEEFP